MQKEFIQDLVGQPEAVQKLDQPSEDLKETGNAVNVENASNISDRINGFLKAVDGNSLVSNLTDKRFLHGSNGVLKLQKDRRISKAEVAKRLGNLF
jgi:hypothetical protein